MIRSWWIYYIFYFLFTCVTNSYSQLFDLLGEEDHVEIPFEYESNFIIVKIRLNGTLPLNFIFDTGAEHTLLFKKTFTDLLGVPYDKKIKIYGSDLYQDVYAHIVRNIPFEVQPLQPVNMDFLVMEKDYIHLDNVTGVNIDGILGAQFFRHNVVKIDYRKRVLTLFKQDKPPRLSKKFIEFPIALQRNKPYIQANSRLNPIDSAELTLLLDTGAGIGLMLHGNTHDQIRIPENYVKTNLGTGIGGDISGYVARVDQLSFCNFSLTNVITGFQDIAIEEARQKLVNRNGIIGNQILSRFTLVIDYPRSTIYLKPERKFKDKFQFDKSGLVITASGPYLTDFQIVDILENSPAAEAGLQRGDVIVRFKGLGASFYSLKRITSALQKKPGKHVKITVLRNGDRLKKEIVLRDLL